MPFSWSGNMEIVFLYMIWFCHQGCYNTLCKIKEHILFPKQKCSLSLMTSIPKLSVFLNSKENHGASTISRFHFNRLIFRKSKVFHATRELKCILKQKEIENFCSITLWYDSQQTFLTMGSFYLDCCPFSMG